MRLVRIEGGCVLAEQVKLADTFWRRLRGLMFTDTLPAGSGLYLRPCRSVHTYFMNYAIDVLHVDRHYRITGLERDLQPGQRGAMFRHTESIFELPAGTIESRQLKIGQALRLLDS